MQRVFIRRKAGKVIWDPDHKKNLGEDPIEVTLGQYWARRLKDGSVEVVEPTKAKTDKKAETKPTQQDTAKARE